jgi:hypothetical protein
MGKLRIIFLEPDTTGIIRLGYSLSFFLNIPDLVSGFSIVLLPRDLVVKPASVLDDSWSVRRI